MSGRSTYARNNPPHETRKLSQSPSLACTIDLPLRYVDQILSAIPLHIVVLDPSGCVIWSSKTRSDNVHKTGSDWNRQHETPGDSYLKVFESAAVAGSATAAEVRSGIEDVLLKRSSQYQVEFSCEDEGALCWFRMVVCALNEAEGAIITYLNISEQKETEAELKRYQEQIEQDTRVRIENLERRNTVLRQHFVEHLESECALRQAASVFVNSSEAVVITDDQWRIIKVNEAFSQLSGYRVDEVYGQEVGMLYTDNADSPSIDTLRHTLESVDHWQGEFWSLRKNGHAYPAWGTVDAVRDERGLLLNYISLFSDITSLKESQQQLHFLAHHDPLTGLANRLLFWARLEQSIQHARRHRKKIALLFLDIDQFKRVNDTLGHATGDRLLQVTAERLLKHVRGEDTIARLGGDEFAVIAEEIVMRQDAQQFADKLNTVINEPVEIAGSRIEPSASIGIGLYPDDGESPESLYQAADAWMYRTKKTRQETDLSTHADFSPLVGGNGNPSSCNSPVFDASSCELQQCVASVVSPRIRDDASDSAT